MKTLEAQQRCILTGDLQEGVLDLGSQELVTHACPSEERNKSLMVTKAVAARNMSLERSQGKDKGTRC